MAISFIAAGTVTANATSAATPYPAGIAVGDLLLLTAVSKYSAYTSAPPTGFTFLAEQTGGSGGTGADIGDVRVAVWYRIADGSETGSVNVTKATQTGSVILSRMFLFRRTAGASWRVTATSGVDGTSGTSAWSIVGAANLTLDAGDHVVMVTGANTDAPTWSTHALSATGSTFGTITEQQDSGTTTGDDVRLVVAEGGVITGPSTGLPFYTATTSTTLPEGASIIVRLRENRLMTADVGTYVLTGQPATFQAPAPNANAWFELAWYDNAWSDVSWRRSAAKSLPAAQGSYALTGQAATFRIGYRIAAAQGSIALTGQAATFRRSTVMPAEQGAYTLNGQPATLNYIRLTSPLPAEQGSFALTGYAATLSISRRITANIGTYSLQGQAATLTKGQRNLAASVGSYSLVGYDANFFRANKAGKAWAQNSWYSGAWKNTAWAADFSGINNYVMPAGVGEFDVIGIEAKLKYGYRLGAETGYYTYTGDDALRDILMRAEPGTFVLTGRNAGGGWGRPMPAEAGYYGLTGQDATLRRSYVMRAQYDSYTLLGFAVTFGSGVGISATSGIYALNGRNATLKVAYLLRAEQGQITLTGQNAGLNFGDIFSAEQGTYTVFAQDATLTYRRGIIAEPGYYTIGGQLQSGTGAARQVGAGSNKRRRKRVTVEIDGQLFTVNDEAEAEALLDQMAEVAAQQAKAEAERVVKKRQVASRREKKPLKLAPVEIPVPKVQSADDAFAAELQRQLDEIYAAAARDAELALHMHVERLRDEEDALIMLLLSE